MKIDKNCIAFVDIETRGFDGPVVLVEVLLLNLDTGEEDWFNEWFMLKEALEACLFVVMHNGVGFDVPKLADTSLYWPKTIECDPVSHLPTNIEILDTLVLSRMLCPERKSHSLEAWGRDLGFPKGNFDWEDWDGTATPELVKYCKQDVEVTRRVFFHLQDLMTTTGGNWRKAHDFEYQCQASVDNQGSFYMKDEKATDVIELIALEMEKIRCDVYDDLPMVDLPKSKIKHPPAKQFKQDGTPSAHALRYFPNVGKSLSGKWVFDHPVHGRQTLPWATPIHTQERANFDSTGPLKDWLLEYGWKPTYWNFKDGVRKGPRFQDDSKNVDPALLRLGVSWVPELQRYLTLKHRLNTVVGWINRGIVYADGYLELKTPAIACGARTSRMTHKEIANVPRVTSLYGKELRGLLEPRPGKLLVGWDASALEACMEAHEVWNSDRSYAEALVDGTLHDRNAALLGVDRDTAKTFKYAVLYGASPKKIAPILDCSVTHATVLVDDFWHQAHALFEVKQAYEDIFRKTGYIEGLDGRKLFPSSQHTVLNTRLQSSGAIVMKTAMLITERKVSLLRGSAFDDAQRIIAYHDEEQWEAHPDTAEKLGEIGVASIAEAGLELGIHPPLSGEFKVGSSWADTH